MTINSRQLPVAMHCELCSTLLLPLPPLNAHRVFAILSFCFCFCCATKYRICAADSKIFHNSYCHCQGQVEAAARLQEALQQNENTKNSRYLADRASAKWRSKVADQLSFGRWAFYVNDNCSLTPTHLCGFNKVPLRGGGSAVSGGFRCHQPTHNCDCHSLLLLCHHNLCISPVANFFLLSLFVCRTLYQRQGISPEGPFLPHGRTYTPT